MAPALRHSSLAPSLPGSTRPLRRGWSPAPSIWFRRRRPPVVAARLDHRVRVREQRRAGQLLAAGGDLQRRARGGRALARTPPPSVRTGAAATATDSSARRARLEMHLRRGRRARCPARCSAIAATEFSPSGLIGSPSRPSSSPPGAVEIAAELPVGVAILEVAGRARARSPAICRRGPTWYARTAASNAPHLVAELAAGPLGVDEPAVARVAIREQRSSACAACARRCGRSQSPAPRRGRRPPARHSRPSRRAGRRTGACSPARPAGVQRVVVARRRPGCRRRGPCRRIAQHAVQVAGRGVEDARHARQRERG